MDILSYFGKLLTSNEEKKSKEEFENQRKETKEKLANQLKEKCFMNNDEIEQVLAIVDNYIKKADDFMKEYDYANSSDVSSIDFKVKLSKNNVEMSEKIKEKIKEIMDAKLARAKKMFGK